MVQSPKPLSPTPMPQSPMPHKIPRSPDVERDGASEQKCEASPAMGPVPPSPEIALYTHLQFQRAGKGMGTKLVGMPPPEALSLEQGAPTAATG